MTKKHWVDAEDVSDEILRTIERHPLVRRTRWTWTVRCLVRYPRAPPLRGAPARHRMLRTRAGGPRPTLKRPSPADCGTAKADSTFCVRWRRMVAGPQTARRGKAGAPRSLRSWAPAFPFPEGPCSLGWGVSIVGLLARVLHDVRHASRVTSATPSASTPAAGQGQTRGRREAPRSFAKPPALPAPPSRGALPPAPSEGERGSGGPRIASPRFPAAR